MNFDSITSEINEPMIKKIVLQYQRKRMKEKERYNEKKDNIDFINDNRLRAKNHYENNKDIKKEKYKNDKDFMNARSQYYYYRKINKIDFFKDKYPEKVELLKSRNVIL
tara:strand:+ start:386 stop:712 length:327 start_codon:yes stop_codon:yes gene_type:complete